MTRDVKYALLFVAICAGIYAVAMGFMAIGRSFDINIYPRFVLPAAVLAPLFFSGVIVRKLAEAKPEVLSGKERIVFALIGVLGVACVAALAEADFLYRALTDTLDVTFRDVLFAPLDARYTVGVLFGASFVFSASAVAAYICVIRIPLTLAPRFRRPPASPTDS